VYVTTTEALLAETSDVLSTLVDNHRTFLAFIERRVGNRAVAEEILQSAFVKSLDKLDTIHETAVGWFYRVLRNAIIDHHRRIGAIDRRLDAYATTLEASTDNEPELLDTICRCVTELASTLKPEYADALRRIEIDGVTVKAYADETGITTSNAGVRVFRAREALRRQVVRSCGTCATHGCVDCSCRPPVAG
jgi:RNA polymerase sigma factor (sigma-70 family)